MSNEVSKSASDPLGPIAGVKVLEFGQIAAGPLAGSLLADLGADVVKVERSDGGDGTLVSMMPLSIGGHESLLRNCYPEMPRTEPNQPILRDSSCLQAKF